MDFYGRNDITLGGFLERYCFRETYTCPSESCDTPMVDHVRRFVHDHGCIQIVLKKLDAPIHGYQNSILTWAWCRKCKRVGTWVVSSQGLSWSFKPLHTQGWGFSQGAVQVLSVVTYTGVGFLTGGCPGLVSGNIHRGGVSHRGLSRSCQW